MTVKEKLKEYEKFVMCHCNYFSVANEYFDGDQHFWGIELSPHIIWSAEADEYFFIEETTNKYDYYGDFFKSNEINQSEIEEETSEWIEIDWKSEIEVAKQTYKEKLEIEALDTRSLI